MVFLDLLPALRKARTVRRWLWGGRGPGLPRVFIGAFKPCLGARGVACVRARRGVAREELRAHRAQVCAVDDLMFEPFEGGFGADVVQDCRACFSARLSRALVRRASWRARRGVASGEEQSSDGTILPPTFTGRPGAGAGE